MNQLPQGIPIREMTFEQLQEAVPFIRGWIYPSRDISPFIPLFSGSQRAALNFFGWLAIAMVIAGIVLPFWTGSWWWLFLILGAYAVWQANRKSMEQFFTENLRKDAEFYEAVRASETGKWVKVVVTP